MQNESEAILDELLVLKCRRNDVDAWHQLVRRYEQRLFYFIRRLVDDERDAWDLLQQTWLAAVSGLRKLDQPRAVRTWLYRIARNLAVSHLRRSGSDVKWVNLTELDQVPQPTSEEECWPADAMKRLHESLAKISVAHREVLTLHFLEDISVNEIATITGQPPGTIKSRLYYAKRALRQAIEHEEVP